MSTTASIPGLEKLIFFLGGHDLEMLEIRALLEAHAPGRWRDGGLAWGAKVSDYRDEIDQALADGMTPVLIELKPDIAVDPSRVQIVDHHDQAAGMNQPTSLEQVFRLLRLPPEDWTRRRELVAANDRGHILGMLRVGASTAEIDPIRADDRKAQGITPEHEEQGRRAVLAAKLLADRLTVVELEHDHVATVTDAIAPKDKDKGPGYQSLMVLSPASTTFFGSGPEIKVLEAAHPGGYSGGELPLRGFWEIRKRLDPFNAIRDLRPAWSSWKRPADRIAVSAYRQILIWPLLLKEPKRDDGKPVGKNDGQLPYWVEQFETGDWKRRHVLPKNVPVPDESNAESSDPTYEEIVYFHAFVRDFLYGDGKTEDTQIRRLTRSDIGFAEIELQRSVKPNPPIRLRVPRVELYLCKPEVALLVVEVAWPGEGTAGRLSLADVLTLQSQLRMVYPPYFASDLTKPGNCPLSVRFLGPDGTTAVGPKSDYTEGRAHFDKFTRIGAEPPVVAHWRHLLLPLLPYPGHQENPGEHYYLQVEDERMPGMTYVAVDDPRAVHDGDIHRLTFCDEPDWPGTLSYPYAADFLRETAKLHRYERFWDPDPASWCSTLFLCSGYQFVTLVKSGDSDFDRAFVTHFRHMYFKMGLIVHFHRAALLKFADELSEAVKKLAAYRGSGTEPETQDRGFRDRIEHIQMTFLKFRSRAWFTEVSNQVQARELYALWTDRVGVKTLFEQVDATSQQLHDHLSEYQGRIWTQWAMLVGGVGLILAILGLWIGIQQLSPGNIGQERANRLSWWLILGSVFLVIGLIVFRKRISRWARQVLR